MQGNRVQHLFENQLGLVELNSERKRKDDSHTATSTGSEFPPPLLFPQSKNPGDKDDPETQLFERKMREEAEDLKMESFGVELLNVIGNVYLTKSTTWIKTNRNNFLGLSGFFSRLKEKTGMVKETWSLLGSAINVQMSMEDMQKRQEKGDIDEEELKQMEMDMSGKVSQCYDSL